MLEARAGEEWGPFAANFPILWGNFFKNSVKLADLPGKLSKILP